MEYWVNNAKLKYESTGQTHRGTDTILLDHAIDLTAGLAWTDQGYTIETLFDKSIYSLFRENTIKLLRSLWRKSGLDFPPSFLTSAYHQIADTQEKHLAAVELTKLLHVK